MLGDAPMTAIVELSDVFKSFDLHPVLTGLSFTVEPGTIVGYIGPNGAGKSTTVKMILGLTQPDRGTIKVFDQEIKPGDSEYKKRIGYVPESADVFDVLTAKEYLGFVGQLYGLSQNDAEAKASELLTIVGMKGSINARISGFSKGMRQMVLIIASLLHNPDLLFWDEPLNGLDANSVLIIEEVLQQLRNRGKTIFYSSHILDVVQKVSDRILLLNDGKVIANGTFAELNAEKDNTLQELFNELTGFSEHGQKATDFVNVIEAG
jgi:ABC-2 type transport system ATP-binding protein